VKRHIIDDESTIEIDEENKRIKIEFSRKWSDIIRIIIACAIAILSLGILFLTENVVLKYVCMFSIITCSTFCAGTLFLMLSRNKGE